MQSHQTFCAIASFAAFAGGGLTRQEVAEAAPVSTLRLASTAPDGTPWARELHAYAREVSERTGGQLEIKWYLGGIAGSEVGAEERVRRGQLDGVASGGMMCQRQIPTMRALHLNGLVESREEASYALAQLRGEISDEALASGYALLGASDLGPEIVMTRAAARTLDELKKQRLWRWDLDEVAVPMMREMGFHAVARPVEEAARAYDRGEIDGFIGIPSAALAFQWFHRARFLLPLDGSYLAGCLLVASKSFEKLSEPHKSILRDASARLAARIGEVSEREDNRLTSDVFIKQGMTAVALTPALRSEFFAAARAARERLKEKLAPARLIQRVTDLLTEYRQQHAKGRPN